MLSGNTEGVDPRLVAALQAAAERFGLPIQINSGYRPGDSGQHGSGLAVDIQVSHLTDAQKAQLVEYLHTEHSVPRYITYDGSGHLHIDLSEANGPFWAMHTPAEAGPKGGSNRHMSSAPQWSQDLWARYGTPSATTLPPGGIDTGYADRMPVSAPDAGGAAVCNSPTGLCHADGTPYQDPAQDWNENGTLDQGDFDVPWYKREKLWEGLGGALGRLASPPQVAASVPTPPRPTVSPQAPMSQMTAPKLAPLPDTLMYQLLAQLEQTRR
jgi:hypothetical protein